MTPTYPELGRMEWAELERALREDNKLPFSTHCPLQMPFSRKLVYCDCALNAYVLDFPPDWNSTDARIWQQKELLRTLMVNFAFGTAPFIPDFRQTRMRRAPGGYPIITASTSAWGIGYQLEYCCASDGILHIRGTVDNFDYANRTAHVRLRIVRPIESKVLVYHYRPFKWNASHWVDDDHVHYADEAFYDEHGQVAVLDKGDFQAALDEPHEYSESDYNSEFHWENPYWVEPDMQLRHAPAMLHLQCELEPGRKAMFELAVNTETGGTEPVFDWGNFDSGASSVEKCLNSLAENTATVFPAGGKAAKDVFNAVKYCNLQLLMDTGKHLQPCQGGLNERFFVWVWEAAESLRPMLRLGYHATVRKVLDYVWSLQSGGCPPKGEFQSLDGAIGTTGPKWSCTTGIALSWAVDHIEYSDDREFLEQKLDAMIAAGKWIVGEISATRNSQDQYPGIMPPCCATDADYGRCLSITDSCSLNGLASLARLLEKLHHPAAEYFGREARQYKTDLDNVMDSVTHPDGFIERSVGDKARVSKHFDNCCSVIYCYAQGANTMEEPRMRNFLQYMEKNIFRGWFSSEVTRGIYYIGNHELAICKAYLDLGEWKKAYAAATVFRRFALTPDLALTQERYSEDNSGFSPWQPNASNNGRYIELELHCLWHEASGRIVLGGALSPWDVTKENCLGFNAVHTSFGLTNLKISRSGITIDCERPIPAGILLVQPGGTTKVESPISHLELEYLPDNDWAVAKSQQLDKNKGNKL